GSGLTLGAFLRASSAATPLVRISPDNTVTLICKHVEVRLRVWTGLSAVLAEELGASWKQMRAEAVPSNEPTYGSLAFEPNSDVRGDRGSTPMASSWQQFREAGATARAMLVAAAAQRWSVRASEVTVSEGVVAHPSGRRVTFGELVGDAATQP